MLDHAVRTRAGTCAVQAIASGFFAMPSVGSASTSRPPSRRQAGLVPTRRRSEVPCARGSGPRASRKPISRAGASSASRRSARSALRGGVTISQGRSRSPGSGMARTTGARLSPQALIIPSGNASGWRHHVRLQRARAGCHLLSRATARLTLQAQALQPNGRTPNSQACAQNANTAQATAPTATVATLPVRVPAG